MGARVPKWRNLMEMRETMRNGLLSILLALLLLATAMGKEQPRTKTVHLDPQTPIEFQFVAGGPLPDCDVEIEPFWISVSPVTKAQWNALMKDSLANGDGEYATGVTLDEAVVYAGALSDKLARGARLLSADEYRLAGVETSPVCLWTATMAAPPTEDACAGRMARAVIQPRATGTVPATPGQQLNIEVHVAENAGRIPTAFSLRVVYPAERLELLGVGGADIQGVFSGPVEDHGDGLKRQDFVGFNFGNKKPNPHLATVSFKTLESKSQDPLTVEIGADPASNNLSIGGIDNKPIPVVFDNRHLADLSGKKPSRPSRAERLVLLPDGSTEPAAPGKRAPDMGFRVLMRHKAGE